MEKHKYKAEYMKKGGTIIAIFFIIASVKIYNFLFDVMHYPSAAIMLMCTAFVMAIYFICFIAGWIKDRHEKKKSTTSNRYENNIKLLEDTEWCYENIVRYGWSNWRISTDINK